MSWAIFLQVIIALVLLTFMFLMVIAFIQSHQNSRDAAKLKQTIAERELTEAKIRLHESGAREP
jgi:large-conductance mechanosensitive channel